MKKSLILTSLLVGAISFGGCGSDDDSSGGGGGGGLDTLTVKPLTSKVVCDPKAFSEEGETYDVKFYAKGDVTVVCQDVGKYTFGVMQLVEGVDSLTVVDLEEVRNIVINTVKTKGTVIDKISYKTGKIHHNINVISDGKEIKINCTETYPSPLPATLTDSDSIEDLFDWDMDDNDRIDTTCPDSYYEDDESDESDKGDAKSITNYTITDSNGKKHLLTATGTSSIK